MTEYFVTKIGHDGYRINAEVILCLDELRKFIPAFPELKPIMQGDGWTFSEYELLKSEAYR